MERERADLGMPILLAVCGICFLVASLCIEYDSHVAADPANWVEVEPGVFEANGLTTHRARASSLVGKQRAALALEWVGGLFCGVMAAAAFLEARKLHRSVREERAAWEQQHGRSACVIFQARLEQSEGTVVFDAHHRGRVFTFRLSIAEAQSGGKFLDVGDTIFVANVGGADTFVDGVPTQARPSWRVRISRRVLLAWRAGLATGFVGMLSAASLVVLHAWPWVTIADGAPHATVRPWAATLREAKTSATLWVHFDDDGREREGRCLVPKNFAYAHVTTVYVRPSHIGDTLACPEEGRALVAASGRSELAVLLPCTLLAAILFGWGLRAVLGLRADDAPPTRPHGVSAPPQHGARRSAHENERRPPPGGGGPTSALRE
jgi:hypothetical protein